MEFLSLDKKELREFFDNKYKRYIDQILDYMIDNFAKEDLKQFSIPDFMFNKTKRYQATKGKLISVILELFDNPKFITKFYETLNKSEVSKHLYYKMIWENRKFDTKDIISKFNIKVKSPKVKNYDSDRFHLEDELSLVIRLIRYSYRGVDSDILYIKRDVRDILKLLYPIPNDYNLIPKTKLIDTGFTYSNENEILPFIRTISEMLENNLVEFGKTNEKPLIKSLNILKQSTTVNEFYNEKKLDSFVVDMLTRSFYYYKDRFNFKDRELDTLRVLMEYQLQDRLNFTISRIFTSHLKKIRFGKYQNEQEELFNLVKDIVESMPKESWVGFGNILNYTYYRESYFRFEDGYRTQHYEFGTDDETLYVGNNHAELFHEPILKAVFFYLGALGLMELKYDKPTTNYENIKAKGKPYISVWDGLKYVKLTELGKYVFKISNSYIPKEIVTKKIAEMKFDEFKPIVTVDRQNSIAIAKLEPFVEKLDGDRYILNHSKLFKDCNHLKALNLKIDSFYKKIEKNPPKVFVDFFDEAIANSNLIKRNLKQIVIELKDNKKLLNLFMSNRKLQELFIKAEGYRIIVLKEDMIKVTKIVKDNGFFVEF